MILEELRENPVKYLKSLAMDIVVVIVAIAYIFYQMITLEPTQLNPIILVAEALMGIICGVLIKQSLGENGFSKGYNSELWVKEEELYNNACNTAIEYMDRVDNFYLVIEKEKKENYRRNHLQGVRLKYSEWFDKEGNYIGTKDQFDKLTFWQKRMVKRCIRVHIFVLNLFSEYETSSEQDTKKELTVKRQRGKNISKNALSATLIAIIGVYFIPVIDSWNWASLIASTMQVALWVLFGILQLYQNFNFIVVDKVAILRRKKELISRFVKGSKENLYLTSPYQE